MNYAYTLEVITPVHIGTGKKIYPFEYVVDGNRVIFVDIDRLLADEGFLSRMSESDFNGTAGWDFNLTAKYSEAKVYPRYVLPADERTCLLLEQPDREIMELSRDAAGWYLPGTSLKGALRTLVYKGNDCPQLKEIWEREISASLNSWKEKKKPGKEFLASGAEKASTGDPNHSLFRALVVSDSTAVGEERVAVYTTMVMGRRNQGWQWKILPKGYTDSVENATPLVIIAFSPGTRFAGTIALQQHYLGNAEVRLRGKEYFENLWRKIQSAVLHLVEEELTFYQEALFSEGINFYAELKNTCEKLPVNEIIFPMGWGTGYNSKTYRQGVSPELWKNVAGAFKFKVSEDLPYPKTRKIVFRNGKPWAPPGWVKMTLTEKGR